MRCGLLFKLSLCGVLVALAISSIHIWLKEKDYLLSEDVISKLGKDALKKHGRNTARPLHCRFGVVSLPLTYTRSTVHG